MKVDAEALRARIDPALFERERTADYPEADLLDAQPRARDAIAFGAAVPGEGFNIYVMGPRGSGRRTALRAAMAARAAERAPAEDWAYVHNFDAPHRPKALCTPRGTATRLRDAMAELVEDLAVGLPAAFEGEEYAARRSALETAHQAAHEERVGAIRERAEAQDVGLIRTPLGLGFAPLEDGAVVEPKTFRTWPEARRSEVEQAIEALQAELEREFRSVLPAAEKRLRAQIRDLDRETAGAVIAVAVSETREAFDGIAAIEAYLDAVEEDLVANARIFLALAKAGEEAPLAVRLEHPALRRYSVNVLDAAEREDGDEGRAPVVEEPDPTYANLIGRIEHQPQQGALVTDFTMIAPGALHRANGGFLILEARTLLMQPFAWEALKRCLRTGAIRIAPLGDRLGLVSTTALEPDPIPLSVKVALIGDRLLYYLLCELDSDFAGLFKVEADFDDAIARSDESIRLMGRLIAGIARREALAPFDRGAMAAVLEEAARLADDAAKLSLRIGPISDLMREAAHCAAGADAVTAEHVRAAVAARRDRAGRIHERMVEAVSRGLVAIDTEGAAVGQVNGLSVVSLGAQRFGRPARITARVRPGGGGVVDIEREAKLGGPIHSKGVMILASLLSARYGGGAPASLSASLVFEQSYGGVDGDSASAAELIALISALAEAPLSQSLAITGSIDQFGRVQAIGGVNEKIEGFFDVCAARGLTGAQGVIAPEANRQHLHLREDVAEAVAEGRFAVHTVRHVDEALALLSGDDPGAPDAAGAFPPDSVNGRAAARLAAFAATMREFGRRGGERAEPARDER
jgi:lon-related putative ATP-dependent protease